MHDDVAVSSERVRRARVGEVGLPVVVRLGGRDAIPGGDAEVARANVVPGLRQSWAESAADLPTRSGDEDPHPQR